MKSLFSLLAAAVAMAACAGPSESGQSSAPKIPRVTGVWSMESDSQGRTIPANLILEEAESGELSGIWESMDQEMELRAVSYQESVLRFERPMGRAGNLLTLEGRVIDGELIAMQRAGDMKIPCIGKRFSLDREAPMTTVPTAASFDEESEYREELQLDYERNARRAAPRDAFDVLTMPDLVPAVESETLEEDEFVLGVHNNGEARAYPIGALGSSELINDVCGGEPIAASW